MIVLAGCPRQPAIRPRPSDEELAEAEKIAASGVPRDEVYEKVIEKGKPTV
jgi:hypothetical protein